MQVQTSFHFKIKASLSYKALTPMQNWVPSSKLRNNQYNYKKKITNKNLTNCTTKIKKSGKTRQELNFFPLHICLIGGIFNQPKCQKLMDIFKGKKLWMSTTTVKRPTPNSSICWSKEDYDKKKVQNHTYVNPYLVFASKIDVYSESRGASYIVENIYQRLSIHN